MSPRGGVLARGRTSTSPQVHELTRPNAPKGTEEQERLVDRMKSLLAPFILRWGRECIPQRRECIPRSS